MSQTVSFNRKLFYLLVPTLMVLGAAIFVLIMPSPRPPRPPARDERVRQFIQCFQEEFAPTEEQVQSIGKLPLEKQAPERNQEIEKLKRELESGLESRSDATELLQKFDQIENIKKEMAETHFRNILKIRDVLREDQRKSFSYCRQKMMKQMNPGGPFGTPPPPPPEGEG